jgi:hypothetical protein
VKLNSPDYIRMPANHLRKYCAKAESRPVVRRAQIAPHRSETIPALSQSTSTHPLFGPAR